MLRKFNIYLFVQEKKPRKNYDRFDVTTNEIYFALVHVVPLIGRDANKRKRSNVNSGESKRNR